MAHEIASIHQVTPIMINSRRNSPNLKMKNEHQQPQQFWFIYTHIAHLLGLFVVQLSLMPSTVLFSCNFRHFHLNFSYFQCGQYKKCRIEAYDNYDRQIEIQKFGGLLFCNKEIYNYYMASAETVKIKDLTHTF